MPVKSAKKTTMPQRAPNVRNKDFLEVNQGYTLQHAMFEADRCLRCQ